MRPIVPFFSSRWSGSDKFKPEFVIISAGFDAHCDDPLASMGLTDGGYAELTTIVTGIAETPCTGEDSFLARGRIQLDGLGNIRRSPYSSAGERMKVAVR